MIPKVRTWRVRFIDETGRAAEHADVIG